MLPRVARWVLVALALSSSPVVFAQSPLNLDFEIRGDDPSFPEGWFVGGQGYEIQLDEADRRSGLVSLRATQTGNQAGAAVATSTLPVNLARGKTVVLSGAIKVDNVSTGYAGFWLRVDGPDGKMLGFDNMSVRVEKGESIQDDRGARGSAGWKRYKITVPVDAAATNINFGCLHTGNGTARFDALAIEIDGKPLDEAWEDLKTAAVLEPKQSEWLKANVIPFKTALAGNGFDDLQPMKKVIGDAHIVSLGEATHGTAEFFAMKHRLTEFLATEMGFTVFAIEASMPEAFRLNDFVLRGEGDPKELLRGMYFWTWNTQEVLDMILWMREFNKAGKGRMEFLGFDMQEPKVAAENVRAFVEKADPEYKQDLERAYAGLKSYSRFQREISSPGGDAERARGEIRELVVSTNEVISHLEKNRDKFLKEGPEDAQKVDWMIQNARIVGQAVNVLVGSGDYRDRCMADNVDWILKHRPEATKIVLWAHNGHVSRQPGAMGSFLSERHGKDMAVVGFAFHEGRYTAVARGAGLQANEAGVSEPGSIEWILHQNVAPRAILDLRKAEKGSAESAWLVEPILHRNIGALAMKRAFFPRELPKCYDILVFFDQTRASVLLQ